MIFSEIIERLSNISDLHVLSCSIEDEITEVRFMDSSQDQFLRNVLYFSNIAQEHTALPPQCILTVD